MIASLLAHIDLHGARPTDWCVRVVTSAVGVPAGPPGYLVCEAYSARDALDVALALAKAGCRHETAEIEDESAMLVALQFAPARAGSLREPASVNWPTAY